MADTLTFDGIEAQASQLTTLATAYGVRIAGVTLLLFIVWIIANHIRRLSRAALARARVDETVAKFLSNSARWLLLVLAGLSILSVFGVQVTSFAAILGAAGVAIGLAFQGTLSSFAAGVMLLVFRPFKVGDTIKVANQTGKVDEIDLFTTTLDTADCKRVILPNSAVFGSTIENMTYHAERRIEVDVTVDAAWDLDLTKRVVEASLETVESTKPARRAVALTNVTAAETMWQVQVWTRTAEMAAVREQTLRAIRRAVDAMKRANAPDVEERPDPMELVGAVTSDVH